MNKIKLNFSKEKIKKIIFVFLRYRYLFILIFFSVFSAFTFNVIYKDAYTSITLMEYRSAYESMVISDIKKGNRTFQEILSNVEEKNEKFQAEEGLKYNNFFKFKESDLDIIDKEDNGSVNSGKEILDVYPSR